VAALWYRLRVEWRHRWKAALAVGLIAGLAAAITLATTAGVRRSNSAFERLAAATASPDVLVNPDAGTRSDLDDAAIARLPEVERAGRVDGVAILPLGGRAAAALNTEVFVSRGQAFYTVDRGKLLRGHAPDRRAADDAMVNRAFAQRYHLDVGDVWHAALVTDVDAFASGPPSESFLDEVRAGRHRDVVTPVSIRIVGVFVDAASLVTDQAFDVPQIALPPAFERRYDPPVLYWGASVRLRPGSTLASFEHAVDALPHRGSIAYQSLTATGAKVQRAVRPESGALTIFAVVVGLIGLLVVGQTIARQTAIDADDHATLRALGLGRRQLFTLSLGRTVPAAVLGAVVGVAGAYLLSPTMPIGVARLAEPRPGFDFDPLVLLVGGAAVFAVVLALAALPAWRAASGTTAETARRHRVAALTARLGARPVPAAGVRMALDPGVGASSVPVRSTITSALAAVAAVTAAIVVATSLGRLVSTPTLYGWNWDGTVAASGDPGTAVGSTAYETARTERVLADDRVVTHWARFDMSTLDVDDHPVTTVGKVPGTAPRFVIAAGRQPRNAREIALGARTMRTLGVSIGGRVQATNTRGRTVSLVVVGRVVLPALGTYTGSDKTSPGEGAFVTAAALRQLAPRFDSHQFLFDFRAGTSARDRRVTLTRIRTAAESEDSGSGVPQPSDIVAYRSVRSTPTALAAALALLAVLTLAHGLVSSVRRRRRELAMLKTLGFTRRQVSATVAWHASTVAVIAVVVGVPLGVVGGRWAWTALADDLGTVARPVVPLVVLLVGVPALVLLANAVAFVPGRVAARLRPSVALRSE
jgi:ABC-type lipoprotein release transport system permease subunit